MWLDRLTFPTEFRRHHHGRLMVRPFSFSFSSHLVLRLREERKKESISGGGFPLCASGMPHWVYTVAEGPVIIMSILGMLSVRSITAGQLVAPRPLVVYPRQ